MNAFQEIESSFDKIGAQVRIRPLGRGVPHRRNRPLIIDVVSEEKAEHFDIQLDDRVRLEALDVRPRERHLVLSASNATGEDRFLCGHDEFHWFAAALPHVPNLDTVAAAGESLKPDLVIKRERRKRRGKHSRKSDVVMRQGEWFFIPWAHARINRAEVECNGRLIRGPGSKPHQCEFLYEAGEREYECDRYPKLAFFESEYQTILKTRRKARLWNWRPIPFNPDIYVKGWITHSDHSPLYLDVWHRVELNKENTRMAMSRLIYVD